MQFASLVATIPNKIISKWKMSENFIRFAIEYLRECLQQRVWEGECYSIFYVTREKLFCSWQTMKRNLNERTKLSGDETNT